MPARPSNGAHHAHHRQEALRAQSADPRGTAPILFVTLSLDVGGAERQIALVTSELVRRGWPVAIYCFNREGPLAETVRAGGVELIAPPVAARGRSSARALRGALSMLGAMQLYTLLRRRRWPIAHFFLTEAYLFGAPIARLAGVPIRIMSRREITLARDSVARARALEARLHPQMTAILGNSREVVRDLCQEGCSTAQLGLIYNGVDPAAAAPPSARHEVRRELGITDDEIVAVMVANLIGYKGHADLIEAVSRLPGPQRRQLRLLLVGRDDGERARLEQQVAEAGIADRISFLGLRRDVPRILRAADIGVHASHTEGFANAILEEMAAGLPMLVTDVGGNPDAVLDGAQGFVVPARAPGALSVGLSRLIADAGLRQRFGAASRQRVASQFTLATCVDHYEALYRGLLAGKAPAEIVGIGVTPPPLSTR